MGLTWKGYHRNREEVLKRLKKGNYEAITSNNQGLIGYRADSCENIYLTSTLITSIEEFPQII